MDKGKEKIHFIGVGGSGMSGIATILLQKGYIISGSDLKEAETTDRLKKMGADIKIGHNRKNIDSDTDIVVVSTAIREDNPELSFAREKGLKVLRRGEMLAELMNSEKGIAVAGSHGKTTTSSMIALVLEKNGLDPTVVVGGDINELGGNAKLGRGEYFVAEADESDGSFLLLSPFIEVITNIEDDHMDYYGSRQAIKEAFMEFARKVHKDGSIILCKDDENAEDLLREAGREIITYGVKQPALYSAKNIRTQGLYSCADVYYKDNMLGKLELNVPGLHNISNAMAAIAAGRIAGLDFTAIAGALKNFRGVHRRFELLGEVNGINVVDDYAHHPTEVKATLRAAKQTGAKRIIGIFQPHRYTRTKYLFREFGQALLDADIIIVTEIYPAGESSIEGVTAELVIDAIPRRNNKEVHYIKSMDHIVEYLGETARPGDLIMTLGAGNIRMVGKSLVEKLKER